MLHLLVRGCSDGHRQYLSRQPVGRLPRPTFGLADVALTNFSFPVTAYFLLLRDEYPSTDEEQAVHLVLPYSDARVELNRWLPLVKWLLAIPHYIVLTVLGLASVARRRSFESAQWPAVANLVHGDAPHLVVAAGTVRQPSIGAVETLRAVIANENPEHGFEEALAPHAGSRFGHQ
jgi:hypothetical protein